MALRPRSIAAVSCAAITAFSIPASASPKTDCESGLQQAQVDFDNSVDEGTIARKKQNSLHQMLLNARKLQKAGKYKKCVAVVTNVRKQLGIK